MTDLNATLAERGKRYGSFYDHATIAQGLQEVLHEAPNWYKLQPDVRQMMIVITDKMARILNGDPDYTDNYHDIQGYARLVESRLLEDEKNKKGKLFEDDIDPEAISSKDYQPTISPIFNGAQQEYHTIVNGDPEAVGNYRG